MKFRKIILTALTLLSAITLCAEEKTEEKKGKIYEISVGGSFALLPGSTHIINYVPYYTAQITATIPFSMNFYLAKYFALGFTLSGGIGASGKFFSNNYNDNKFINWILFLDAFGTIAIVNKIGRIDSQHRMQIEYGMVFTGRFVPYQRSFVYEGDEEDALYNPFYMADTHFLFGPLLFVGYDYKVKKTEFIVGLSVKAQFGNTKYYTYSAIFKDIEENLDAYADKVKRFSDYYEYTFNVNVIDVYAGIELRWLFSY